MAERSCVSLPTVRHYIQTLSTGVFRSYTVTIIIAAYVVGELGPEKNRFVQPTPQ